MYSTCFSTPISLCNYTTNNLAILILSNSAGRNYFLGFGFNMKHDLVRNIQISSLLSADHLFIKNCY